MIFGTFSLAAPSSNFVTSTIVLSGIGPLNMFASTELASLMILDWGSGSINFSAFTNAGGSVALGAGTFFGGAPAFIALGVTGFTVVLTCSAGGSPSFMEGNVVAVPPS